MGLLWFDVMDLMDDNPDWSITKPLYQWEDDDDDVMDLPDYPAPPVQEKIDDTNSVKLRRIVYNPDGSVKKVYYQRYVC